MTFRPRSSRRIVGAVAASLTALLVSCSAGERLDAVARASDQTAFPTGFRQWHKLNRETIVHETEREARDLYFNDIAMNSTGPEYPPGSVLVKEEFGLRPDVGGQLRVGDPSRISVMFKVGRGNTSGWAFKAFDPETRSELPRDRVDPDGCYFCHADRRDHDYVFTGK